jgi:hypothetical protein
MVEDLIKRLRRADLSAINKACEILDGLPQDAIDGGWTARGISAYANRLEGRLTALESERDALLAAAGKEAVKTVDSDLVLRCQELEELATRGESEQTALNRLADTYLLDISAHDRKAMARNQTHHEAMRFVISAAAAPTAAQGDGDGRDALEYPSEFTDDLKWILGLMCFQCIPYAQTFRAAGVELPTKAEAEQAYTLDWLLRRYLKDPENWRKTAVDEMRALSQQKAGEQQ